MRQHIGQYRMSEAPTDPLQYQYLDADGVALDISAFAAAKFHVWNPSRTWAEHASTIVSAWNGVVAVDWTTAMTNAVGVWRGEFWLDGAVASDTLVWTVVDGPGPTVGA